MRDAAHYSVADFFDDVGREFKFLEEDYDFVVNGTSFQGGDDVSGVHRAVVAGAPRIAFTASMRHVEIAHEAHEAHGRVAVTVTKMYPGMRKASVKEIAAEARDQHPERFTDVYDLQAENPGVVLTRLAAGLREYGADWLTEPEPPM